MCESIHSPGRQTLWHHSRGEAFFIMQEKAYTQHDCYIDNTYTQLRPRHPPPLTSRRHSLVTGPVVLDTEICGVCVGRTFFKRRSNLLLAHLKSLRRRYSGGPLSQYTLSRGMGRLLCSRSSMLVVACPFLKKRSFENRESRTVLRSAFAKKISRRQQHEAMVFFLYSRRILECVNYNLIKE